MRYSVTHKDETFEVEVHEVAPHAYDVTIDDGETVRVDAFKTPRTVYSILLGSRQYEGSVDPREDGTLDIHLGSSAFDFHVIDQRRQLLVGSTAGVATGVQEVRAQMPGKVVKLMVSVGQEVARDDALLILEAMKMENEIRSPIDGVVVKIGVVEGEPVEVDQLMVIVEPPDAK